MSDATSKEKHMLTDQQKQACIALMQHGIRTVPPAELDAAMLAYLDIKRALFSAPSDTPPARRPEGAGHASGGRLPPSGSDPAGSRRIAETGESPDANKNSSHG